MTVQEVSVPPSSTTSSEEENTLATARRGVKRRAEILSRVAKHIHKSETLPIHAPKVVTSVPDDWAQLSRVPAAPAAAPRQHADQAVGQQRAAAGTPAVVDHDKATTSERITVPACDKGCQLTGNARGWCEFQVELPAVDWLPAFEADHLFRHAPSHGPCGYQRLVLGGGLRALVVDQLEQVAPAVAELRESMGDGVLAIDLEWRPSFQRGVTTSLALMQIASATCALLLRVKLLGGVPRAVRDLLAAPDVVVAGFDWDGSDEGKLQGTAGYGRAVFSSFVDVAAIAQSLGYRPRSLVALANVLVHHAWKKSKKVTMSNWEAKKLSDSQMRYAALDALMTGAVLRQLRVLHAHGTADPPATCSSCQQVVGVAMAVVKAYRCESCAKRFSNAEALTLHVRESGHVSRLPGVCAQCHRSCNVELEKEAPVVDVCTLT